MSRGVLEVIYLKTYCQDLQQELEDFFIKCFRDMGWEYEPEGRHSDVAHACDVYMKNGYMWCLYDDADMIGTVAVRTVDKRKKIAEMKRLYVLKNYQGKGYGRLLFEKALFYCEENTYVKIRVDTRKDRDASLHLIRKYGFQEIERYNDNPFAELFFERNLSFQNSI